MALELRVLAGPDFTENGEILANWSDLTFSQDLIDPGTLDFTYPVIGTNADLLVHGVQLVVLLDGVEPINGRFTYFEGTGSRIQDAEGLKSTYHCPSNLGRLSEMMVAPAFGSEFADPDAFAMTDATPGQIMLTAIDNSMSRSVALGATSPWLTHPVITFTATHDSTGAPWSATYDYTPSPGSSCADILSWLTEHGFAEAYLLGKDLYLVAPENNGTDYAQGDSPITLISGQSLTEAGYQTSSTDLATAVLVVGDDNTCAWVYDTEAIATYGYREKLFSVQGASTQGTLIAAGQAYLDLHKVPRYSYTYAVGSQYLDTPSGLPRPFVDFRVGDTVLTMDGEATSPERVRLLSATWSESSTAQVAISVNDFFAEREVEFDRRLTRLELGS